MFMKNLFTLLLSCCLTVCFCSPFAHAQTGWQWAKSSVPGVYGDEIDGIADADGNVYMSGYSWDTLVVSGTDTLHNSPGFTQLMIVKTDSSGNTVWVRGLYNTNIVLDVAELALDASGNLFVLCGYTSPTFTMGGITLSTISDSTFVLIKMLPDGTTAWAQNLTLGTGGIGYGLDVDSYGNVYVVGTFVAPSISVGGITATNHNVDNTADIFIAKYGGDGTPLWVRGYGGSKDDYPAGITINDLDHIYLTGYFTSDSAYFGASLYTLLGSASNKSFLAKTDTAGSCLWAENIGLFITDLITDNSDNVFANGSLYGPTVFGADTLNTDSAGGASIFLVKYDSIGNPGWGNVIYMPGEAVYPYSIGLDVMHNVWLSGDLALGTGHHAYFGTFALAQPGHGYDPMFVAEYNAAGVFDTAIAIPSGGDDENNVTFDSHAKFYVTGDYYDCDMVLGPDTLSNPSPTQEYLYVAKYRYDPCPGAIGKAGISYTVDSSGVYHFYYTGSPYSGISWTLGDGTTSTLANPTHTYATAGMETVCVTITTRCTAVADTYCVTFSAVIPPLRVAEASSATKVTIQPNPSSGTIRLDGAPVGTGLQLFDITGKKVAEFWNLNGNAPINVDACVAGVYVAKILLPNGGVEYGKLVVER
jgi:PKD domain